MYWYQKVTPLRAYPVQIAPTRGGVSGRATRVFSISLSLAVQGGWFEPGAARPQVEVLPLCQARPSKVYSAKANMK
jgi:hypothetical protein